MKFEKIFFSSVYIQIDEATIGSVKEKIRNELIKRFVCKENTTLVRKKKDRSVIAKDTVRADDRRAMVLIEETVNIF